MWCVSCGVYGSHEGREGREEGRIPSTSVQGSAIHSTYQRPPRGRAKLIRVGHWQFWALRSKKHLTSYLVASLQKEQSWLPYCSHAAPEKSHVNLVRLKRPKVIESSNSLVVDSRFCVLVHI